MRVKGKIMKKFWKLTGAIVCVIAVLLGIGLWVFTGKSEPQPTFTLNVTAPDIPHFINDATAFIASDGLPDINNNREVYGDGTLVVNYDWIDGPYSGAFRENLTESDIAKNVKITPFIAGRWVKTGPSTLVFTPRDMWPADTKFKIKISSKLTNDDIKIKSYRAKFASAPVSATLDSFAIYPAPKLSGHVVAVAIVSFNWPVDTNTVANNTSLRIDGRDVKFTVAFDKFQRTAIIKSAPVAINGSARNIKLKIKPLNVINGTAKTQTVTATTTIESADNFFKATGLNATVAQDARGDLQQMILLDMTSAASRDTNWYQFVEAYLLPEFADSESETEPHEWKTDEVNDAIIAKSERIAIRPMEFATPNGVHQYAFGFTVPTKTERYMFISVRDGVTSAGGFVMQNGLSRVLPVPYPPREVKIAGTGALLSMGGDRMLGITARGGVDTAYVNLSKINSSEINHLISQTYNLFGENINFREWSFGTYDMATVFQKKITFADSGILRTNYASVNMGDYLDRDARDKTGLFIVQVGESENAAEYGDRRLIVLTDLGIIRKQNLDGSSALFVSQLSDGAPAGDIEISVIGRNGRAVWAGRTDENGYADIPKLDWSEYKNEKEPIAIIARRDDDVSFIPYSLYSTHVEYSKFDIDGAYDANALPLNAYVFSDRGIYRPGESATIGVIVKNKTFASTAGVPVKLEITDSRERVVFDKTVSLTSDGLFDATYQVPDSAVIGDYMIRVYSVGSKNKVHDCLGTATIRIEEFTPDTMKIHTNITGASENGWIAPHNLNATVSLHNLFGTPAASRRVTAHAVLRPIDFTFNQYPDYTFTQNVLNGSGLAQNSAIRAQTVSVDLPDATTDENGNAILPIIFNSVPSDGTYSLSLTVNGFEGASGKSVQTTVTTRVSNAQYLIGYHTDSDLSYINRETKHSVHFIALDANANPTVAKNIKIRLILRENVTSLIKDANDYYKYNTITRDKTIYERKFNIPKAGANLTLNTNNGGTYFLQMIDENGRTLANVEYFVATDKNTAMNTDKNAELKLKLDSAEYKPGSDITMNITAPYTGTGLITIERERVYAYKWFQTDSTTSVQTIKLPENFEGNGYINVSFVRDINSRDIFTTPFAYAVAPFRADTSARKIDVQLHTPEVVRDNKLKIEYETNRDARIMIFAVNSGILQVAKYATPNPFAHFFKKSALQVETFQILSLLLPEYKVLSEFAKTGGGDWVEAAELAVPLTNPFGRKTNRPVVFYSGILDTTANTTNSVEFDIPEYFNGAVRVFAVAVSDSAIGANESNVKIQSPVIISTTTPAVVAPNDEFDINAVISNMTENSGENATANINATVSNNLKIIGNAAQTITVPENTDALWKFTVTAGDVLGDASIAVDAGIISPDGRMMSRRTIPGNITIRPTTPIQSSITSGTINSISQTVKRIHIDMYPEFAKRYIYISRGNSAFMRPIAKYLAEYEYTCTEQIASRGLVYAISPDNAIIGTSGTESVTEIDKILNELKNRQNDDGSFDLYAGSTGSVAHAENDSARAYLTAYVANFLTIAQTNGFNVPKQMLSRALEYLRTYAGNRISDTDNARATAFAIYVATKNGFITTGYIDSFEEYANKNIPDWSSTVMGAYIASAYKILKQNAKADNLIGKYRMSVRDKFIYNNEFDNNIANDAMYEYLRKTHFDGRGRDTETIIQNYINSGNYTSFTSGVVLMALGASPDMDSTIGEISVVADGRILDSINNDNNMFVAQIPNDAARLEIKCADCNPNTQTFYTIWQSGFPKSVSAHSDGLEIIREYYNDSGNKIKSGNVGDTITVKLFLRARGRTDYVPNVVITDLLPGGFIPGNISGEFDFAETREDRVLVYTNATRETQTITYTAQLGTAGRFSTPAVTATAMNNPQISAIGRVGDTFTVMNATQD